jgi:transcriptional regulator with XRE-family HTH domain
MVGENIAAARERAGLTQAQLALEVRGTARASTASDWESGKSMPDAPTLRRIAEVCKVTADELVGLPTGQDYRLGWDAGLTAAEGTIRELRARYVSSEGPGAGELASSSEVGAVHYDDALKEGNQPEPSPQSDQPAEHRKAG